MTKAVKCLACGLYYNSQVYDVCPHCSAEKDIKPKIEPEKKGEIVPAGEVVNRVEPVKKTVDAEEKTTPPMPIKGGRRTMPYADISAENSGSSKPEIRTDSTYGISAATEEHDSPIPFGPITDPQTEPSGSGQQITGDLKQQLRKSGRTVGKYVGSGNDNSTDPVVGWLVCVKGTYFGQNFTLHSGKNKIGRSHEFDVKLLNDESVSRTCVAVIVYDAKANAFSLLPGESDSLCYVNAEAVYERKVLSGYEKIELGDSEKNMFVFVPLCGEQFNWSDYQNS